MNLVNLHNYLFSLVTDLFFSVSKQISGTTLRSIITSTFSGHFKGSVVSTTNTNQLGTVLGMAIDVEDNLMYYSDRQSGTLHRVPLNNGAVAGGELVLSNVKAWGMSYDWINRTLYWSEDV